MSKTAGLSLFDFTMIVVSLVIGMGIFRAPLNVAQAVPSTAVFFAAWIAGGMVAYCGALTYAEIGSRLPVMGDIIKYFLTRIIHPLPLALTVSYWFQMRRRWPQWHW